MSSRNIQNIIEAKKVQMGSIWLYQALPMGGLDAVDPFLLIHHLELPFKENGDESTLGVPPHPHRGFSPVTFIFQGDIHHRDSLGNSQVVKAGGTQWMHAGSGVIHSERPSKDLAKDGGVQEVIQFWVNSPQSKKWETPSYLPLHKEDTPKMQLDDGKVEVQVVNGQIGETKSVIEEIWPMLNVRITMEKGSSCEIPVPKDYNALVYQLDGLLDWNHLENLKFKGVKEGLTKPRCLIHFKQDGGEFIKIKALEKTRLILLSGSPIKEPVYSYGPFVMSNKDEIAQAIWDYQNGKMGELKESF